MNRYGFMQYHTIFYRARTYIAYIYNVKKIEYNRQNAVNYANKWALKRNPNYYDFSLIGGDCTNFVSQCIYAGCKVMNYKFNGWFYSSPSLRAPAWTGVNEFYWFAVNNTGTGFYAEETNLSTIRIGDVIQLGNEERFYHTFIVTKMTEGEIYVSSHSIDRLNVPLSLFKAKKIRPLHILGARSE
jgi:hypothetical protein